MNIHLIEQDGACRLVFEGSLTYDFAWEMEDRILDALRRHDRFQVDLSGVREIDLCGIHMLRLFDAVASEKVEIVGESLLVQRARERLLATTRASWLRGSRSERSQAGEYATAA